MEFGHTVTSLRQANLVTRQRITARWIVGDGMPGILRLPQ